MLWDFFKKTIIVVAVLLFLLVIYYARIVFVYIVLAVLLAYVLASPVKSLRKKLKLPASLAFLIIFILLLLLVSAISFAIGERVYIEAYKLVKDIPEIADKLEYKVNKWIEKRFPGTAPIEIEAYAITIARNLQETLQRNLPQTTGKAYAFVMQTFKGFSTFILGILLVPLLAYYFLIDVQKFKESFKSLLPQRHTEKYEASLELINSMMGRYVRGQLALSIVMGFLITIGLLILKVPYAFLLGLIGALAELIPVIGPILSFIPALIIASTVSIQTVILVLVFYILLHVLESQVLVPRIMGKEIDLHPATVLIAMMIGAQVWGFMGVLVALPFSAALKIILNVVYFKREKYLINEKNTSGISRTSNIDL